MTMTAEQLAQQYDLLIANGQLTADTLIALSENEIDSDYFAVTSTNEARGTEVECELSITEFALRASENVRALLDELERKDKRIAELESRTVTVRFTPIPMSELGNKSDGAKHPYMFGSGYNSAVVHCGSELQQACARAGVTLNLTVEG